MSVSGPERSPGTIAETDRDQFHFFEVLNPILNRTPAALESN